ncbi:MAG TPA: alpha/beta hydrolase, partial [Gemmatimonadaceae bacterium]|nr:alpha/beta hydrolase [Gemmatimonadaceae bacterium]
DPRGHGEYDRPRDMWRYTMTLLAEQVVALLDHLEIDEAVVGGTSLGANITLETAVLAPERLRGAVVEMPVLDNALVACAVAFTPLMVALTVGEPVSRVVAGLVRRLPHGGGYFWDVGVDWVGQDPRPSAALLQGLFFGRIAPPRSLRTGIGTRTLVLGHGRDPIHPFSDSDMLVREMPNARLVEAKHILEMRIAPERLTGEVAHFLDECWRPAAAKPRARRRAS